MHFDRDTSTNQQRQLLYSWTLHTNLHGFCFVIRTSIRGRKALAVRSDVGNELTGVSEYTQRKWSQSVVGLCRCCLSAGTSVPPPLPPPPPPPPKRPTGGGGGQRTQYCRYVRAINKSGGDPHSGGHSSCSIDTELSSVHPSTHQTTTTLLYTHNITI